MLDDLLLETGCLLIVALKAVAPGLLVLITFSSGRFMGLSESTLVLVRVKILTKNPKTSSKGILNIIISPITNPAKRNKNAPGADKNPDVPSQT